MKTKRTQQEILFTYQRKHGAPVRVKCNETHVVYEAPSIYGQDDGDDGDDDGDGDDEVDDEDQMMAS